MATMPKYPVYVPSKGRYDSGLTVKALMKDDVPHYIVIEEQEYDLYALAFGKQNLLVLPFQNQGLIAARNWIKDHAVAAGAERHWQLDDNMNGAVRYYKGKKIPCSFGVALRCCEDFVDRYTNVAIAGLNYRFFAASKIPPFFHNVHVYSCTLVNNAIPHRWRERYNDDTDICLQVLADGWCTILINTFLVNKMRTMVVKGGNTADLYQGDGRLKMARALERQWPGVVKVDRRFKRPQHIVKDSWRRFDTPLILKPGLSLDDFKQVDEYGMTLQQLKPIQSDELRQLVQDKLDEHPIEARAPHE